MKITHYGLWFHVQDYWGDNRDFEKICTDSSWFVVLNGNYIGCRNVLDRSFSVNIKILNDCGFKISQESSGESALGWWEFPIDYIVSEKDFEEIE